MLPEQSLAGLLDIGWSNMFVLDLEKVTYLEKIIRPILVYGLLVLLFRSFGKKEIAQLNPVDLIVLLLVSNTVQNAIIGDDVTVIGGAIGVVALLAVNRIIAKVKFHHPHFEKLIEGGPRVMIDNGKINEKAVERELMTVEDLNVIAHREGYEDVSEIDKCVIDPNGVVFVEGSTVTKDERFKKEIVEKIDKLTEQLTELRLALRT